MRILHTSDWHLGHALHGLARDHEHERFLAWLEDVIVREDVDAVVITGDVFDSSNPPARAQHMLYGFLAGLARTGRGIDVVIIGGNHDSAARLEAPSPLLGGLGVRVVGGLPRAGAGVDADAVTIPLHDARGEVAAWVAAVPFLRPADLPRTDAGDGDPLIEGVARVYAEALDAARRRRRPGQALVATGHCYLVGTELSHMSERRILGGNQHALPVGLFPDDVTYAALGHLHKAQRVGGREGVRYAGSPIPLAMDEARYRHQVLLVDLDGDRLAGVRPVEVPRAVELLRVPRRGAAPPEEVERELAALDPERGEDDAERPYLEVCVKLARPEPDLRLRVERALAGKRPRLVKLGVEYTGDGASLAEGAPGTDLADLDPVEVFARRYRRDHDGEPPPELVGAFCELLDAARAGGEA